MWLGYLLIAAGVAVGGATSSNPLVGACVFMAMLLTIALNVDFSSVTAKVMGNQLEVKRELEKRQELESVLRDAVSSTRDPDLVELSRPNVGPESEVWPRELIERLIAVSAQWGWSMSAVGWSNPPEPIIEWSKDGTPQIVAGRASAISGGELGFTGEVEAKVQRKGDS